MENSIIQSAKQEIETVLKKYNVTLIPTIVHQGDATFSRIDILEIPQDNQQPATGQV
jgi:hypothetical protein